MVIKIRNRNKIESYIGINNNLFEEYTGTLLGVTLVCNIVYAKDDIWYYVPGGMQSDLPKLYITIYKVFRCY